ncbi:hypothetical protein [Lacrimispora sp.]|uniref:hypothetical protein n=1 Tax=Lacrimispora sp. TaxID=2719234 RepID=UPI0028B00FF4|nr:hypothetical protein [Lacrimispora sp.]
MNDSELLQAVYKDTQELKSRMYTIEDNVTDIQLTLEDETNHNISLIAEGHLDLSRKLDGALKVENEIRQIKEKINVIA